MVMRQVMVSQPSTLLSSITLIGVMAVVLPAAKVGSLM